MAKFDQDASHADPYARHTNKIALAGLIATLAIVLGGAWLQSHPYQYGETDISTWHATLSYNGAQFDAAGPVAVLPDAQMRQLGTTRDGRGVFEPVGGGGGQGASQLYVQMAHGQYLPIKRHEGGKPMTDLPLGGRTQYNSDRSMRLPGEPPPGILP